MGASALLLAIAGVLAGIAALTNEGPDAPRIVTAVGDTTPTVDAVPAPGDQMEFPSYAPVEPGSVTRTPDQDGRIGVSEPRKPAQAGTRPRAAAGTGAGAAVEPARPAVPPPAKAKPQVPHKQPAAAPEKPAEPVRTSKPATHKPSRPTVTTRIDYQKRDVAFRTRYARDPMLPQGFRRVQVAGASGQQTLRYRVTLTNGRETGRKLVATKVIREPRNQVIVVGSRSDFDRPFDDRNSDDDSDDGGDDAGDDRDECPLDFDLCGPFGRQAVGYCTDTPAEPAVAVSEPAVPDEVTELDCDAEQELDKLPS